MSLAIAVLSTLANMANAGASDRLILRGSDLDPVADCRMAIVLVSADRTPTARAIDRVTGKGGWSHVYFDPCRQTPQGERRVVAYTMREGVHWTDPATYKRAGRVHARIDLDDRTATEIWGCVRARMGRPFRVSHLVAGVDSAATCVGLIVGCLPWAMQERLAKIKVGPCISPNTLATFFGVGSPWRS